MFVDRWPPVYDAHLPGLQSISEYLLRVDSLFIDF